MRFLFFALQVQLQFLQSLSIGAATKFLTKRLLENLKIPVPPLTTQQKIAHILSAYDDLIENNLKRIKLLEEMAQINYEEWFVQMKFPGHENTPVDAETGLPEGWVKESLNEVVSINPRTKVTKDVAAPFVPMGALATNLMVIDGVEERVPSGGSKFIQGDTLVARITPCLENGKTGFVSFLQEGTVATGSTEFIVLRETEKVNRYFIYCLARGEYFREMSIQSMAGSDGRQRVNPAIYKKLKISLPPIHIMEKFEEKIQPAFESINIFVRQNQFLKEARDILLPRLMTGLINVDDIDLPTLESN